MSPKDEPYHANYLRHRFHAWDITCCSYYLPGFDTIMERLSTCTLLLQSRNSSAMGWMVILPDVDPVYWNAAALVSSLAIVRRVGGCYQGFQLGHVNSVLLQVVGISVCMGRLKYCICSLLNIV